MGFISDNILYYKNILPPDITLVAVSKTQPVDAIIEAYQAGHRNFAENYVQELTEKYAQLPKDIIWHFIGHLQSNKVKYIAPFIELIHSVDSYKLLKEINKQALKHQRVINCLIQIHIALEDTKFGMSETELMQMISSDDFKQLNNIKVIGLMGMATNTDDEYTIRNEFKMLKTIANNIKVSKSSTKNLDISVLSMGMSSDWKIALEEGSTMLRLGSSIFGARN
jgi:pyridoxal phosphate enzyme (YggS family)